MNIFEYVERSTLRIVTLELADIARPNLTVDTGPGVANLRIVDMNPDPYGIQQSVRIPLRRMICGYLRSIWDTDRYFGEAAEIRLRFTPRPYQYDGIPVEARIVGQLPPALESVPDFAIYKVMDQPEVVNVGGFDLWKFSRVNPAPPLGGLRAVAFMDDVSSQVTPERLKNYRPAGNGLLKIY